MRFYFPFLIVSFISIQFAFSQTRDELEQKKIQNQKDIEFTNQLIKDTEENKKNSFNKIVLLNNKIGSRLNLISAINQEILYIDNQISIHLDVIQNLEQDLNDIKKEYARIIYYSYKNRNTYDKIMFVLASDNINTAFNRFKYFQQYTKYRKKQANDIVLTKNKLNSELTKLEDLKLDKKELLAENRIESQKLVNEKNEQSTAVKRLTVKEKDLKKQLRTKYDLANRLQKEIERIIEEEARKAAEKLKNSSKDFFQLTPEEKRIAEYFDKNRKSLPWPTVRGIITSSFGEHPHAVLKGVVVRNDGVDITTTEGAIVRSIYDGVVSRIFVIPGAHKTIIIRHGNYLSVYSNLKEVFVKQGDKVKIKQQIGIVFTDKDDEHKSVLQFQIWKENVKMDPQEWLAAGKNE